MCWRLKRTDGIHSIMDVVFSGSHGGGMAPAACAEQTRTFERGLRWALSEPGPSSVRILVSDKHDALAIINPRWDEKHGLYGCMPFLHVPPKVEFAAFWRELTEYLWDAELLTYINLFLRNGSSSLSTNLRKVGVVESRAVWIGKNVLDSAEKVRCAERARICKKNKTAMVTSCGEEFFVRVAQRRDDICRSMDNATHYAKEFPAYYDRRHPFALEAALGDAVDVCKLEHGVILLFERVRGSRVQVVGGVKAHREHHPEANRSSLYYRFPYVRPEFRSRCRLTDLIDGATALLANDRDRSRGAILPRIIGRRIPAWIAELQRRGFRESSTHRYGEYWKH